MAELVGLADCYDDEAGYKAIVVVSEFCEVEMVDLNFWCWLGLASVLEGADKNGVAFEVAFLEFYLVWDQTVAQMKERRGSFSIGVTLAGRE